MAIQGSRVAIPAGGAPTRIFDEASKIVGPQIVLTNSGANPADIGGPGVSVGTGYALAAAASTPPFTLRDDDDDPYAASTAGTTISILVVGA